MANEVFISKAWNSAHVFWQRSPELDVPEAAILVHIDNGGSLIMEQEGHCIVLSPASLGPFCKLLREVVDDYAAAEGKRAARKAKQ